MKILVGVDATPSCQGVVQAAAARPWPAGSSFLLATAIDPFFFARAPALLAKAKKCAQQHLEHTAECLQNAGWNITSEVIVGNPRRAISLFARDWGAELVMVGSRDLSDTKRLFLGSTSQSLLRRAPCSVEIVRTHDPKKPTGTDKGMKLLLATDGSEFSVAAVRSVASRPWPEGTQVKVISAPGLVLLLRECPYFEQHQVEELNAASMKESHQAIASAMGMLSGSGLKVHSGVPLLHDTPSQILLDEAEKWHADMIVIGSHGRSGFDRFTMGSVSEAVALHADCSVEVIRERNQPAK
jgi:nucleotide-binding universal stress UspA family protein